MNEEFVATPVGMARITWYPARGSAQAVALLGHGSVTGIESADLQALADALPRRDITVGLVTQPYRLEANPGAAGEASLDRAWTAVLPAAAGPGLPVIAGGRSAGAQVACRTAAGLGAHARARAGLPATRARQLPGTTRRRPPDTGRARRERPLRPPRPVPAAHTL